VVLDGGEGRACQTKGSRARDPHSIRPANLSYYAIRVTFYATHMTRPKSSAPNFEETLIVAIKQRGTAEAGIGDVIERIDSKIKCSPFLITEVAPEGEIVKESDILITTS
jgi:hypothetical protein